MTPPSIPRGVSVPLTETQTSALAARTCILAGYHPRGEDALISIEIVGTGPHVGRVAVVRTDVDGSAVVAEADWSAVGFRIVAVVDDDWTAP